MKRMMWIMLFFIVGFAVIAGCQPATMSEGIPDEYLEMDNPFPVNATMAGAGEALYMNHCQRCHGEDALGSGSAPDLVASAAENEDGYLYWWVTTGGGSLSMPAFSSVLSDEDVWLILTYFEYLNVVND
jgi:mono/diheme cytochrome c family protein